MGKLVSVIIPTYDSGSYICEAINSVINQTYKNIEVIVIDDGSTDDTKQLLISYIENKKINYIYQKNKGPAAARNLGIRNAKGEFIAFLDADDIWLPKKLEFQIPLFSNQETYLVYSDMELFGPQVAQKKYSQLAGPFFRGNVFKKLIKKNFIPHSSVVVRAEVFSEIGLFNESSSIFGIEDYDLYLRVCLVHNVDFQDESLVRYRLHKNQISRRGHLSYEKLAILYEQLFHNANFKAHWAIIMIKYIESKAKALMFSFLRYINHLD